jgi:hypothetical protein
MTGCEAVVAVLMMNIGTAVEVSGQRRVLREAGDEVAVVDDGTPRVVRRMCPSVPPGCAVVLWMGV